MPKSMQEMAQELAERIRKAHAANELPSYDIKKPVSPCRSDCPICKGQGVFLYDVQPGHPEFNVLHPCPNKPITPGMAGIENIQDISWEDILPEGNAAEGIDAVMAAIEAGHGWVYLYGKPGRAKTLILQRSVKEAIERGMTAKYIEMKKLLDDLRSSFDEDRKQESLSRKLEYLRSYRVLALDELDRFNNTEWAQAEVFDLMNDRYKDALYGHTVTLMAANVPPTAYEPYLYDRIRDARFKVIHLSGDSLRPAADRSMP